MKYAFLLLLLLNVAWAEVTPDEAALMIDQMVKENVISVNEAQKAKARLKVMNPSEWKKMNETAASVAARRSPASVQDVQKTDLDGAQFRQISEDIKKILPTQ